MSHKTTPFYILLGLIILLTGCADSGPSAAPSPTFTTTPIPTAPSLTSTPILSSSPPSPTLPPSPTSTLEPSPSATPTPNPPTSTPTPNRPASLLEIPWEDRSLFEAGLLDSERSILNGLPRASVYHISMSIGDNLTSILGQEAVLYTNTEAVALDDIYFRLFPNLAGGQSRVSNLTVNGQSAEPVYELRDSALRVPLDSSLPPGESTVIAMDFAVEVPTGEGGNYGAFAFSKDVLALAHVYPMIAVYDDEGWNVEIAPTVGDVVYADAGFYVVRVTAPAGQTLVASGVEIDRSESAMQQTVTFAAGPVRDFYLAASGSYEVISRTVGQVTINSYAPADLLDGAEVALDQAAQALEHFNRRFGPYPFTELDLVGTTNFALGIEYPGIVAILLDLYDQAGQVRGQATSGLLEGVVAHEVAHQWFYSLVGNDQVDEPWLDEALAQYATILYYHDVYDEQAAAGFSRSLERRWARVGQADIPIGLPVRDYSVDEYSGIIYGRGPLFIAHLAETMGQATFDEFLQDYYTTYRWGIATGDDFKQLAEQHCQCNLTPLFETWVYPKSSTQ
ncbi:MAG: M1 family metallopeptidase [Anaerolineae bacterium]|nr:M1 family metallopeptidase [Anaerolineae bacterium]